MTVAQLTVIPTSSSIATGTALKQQAIAQYSDGSQEDVTNQVTWSVVPAAAASERTGGLTAKALLTARDTSAASAPATVDQTGRTQGMNPGMTMVQASMEGAQSESTLIVTAATVELLAIRATRALFPQGATQPIQLIGTFSDGTSQDLSLTANWQSSNPAIATIDQTGLATGVSAGSVVFTGSFGGLTASTIGYQVLPSSLISLTLTADSPAAAVGYSQTPKAIGTYSDGTTHDLTGLTTWTSSDPDNYPINSNGLAFCKAPTTAQMTGTVAGFSAIINLACFQVTVGSMDVEPGVPSFALGTTQAMFVNGTFINGLAPAYYPTVDLTKIAVWRSEDPTVLTIDAKGIAKAGKVGTTKVTATFNGVTGESTDVTVTTATLTKLQIVPVADSISGPIFQAVQVAAFTGKHLAAYGAFSDGSYQDITRDVTWNTTDNTIASVDTTGYVIGMKPGQVEVTATMAGQTRSISLVVTGTTLASLTLLPGSSQIPLDTVRQYYLIGTFADGTQQDLTADANWLAPTPFIASVLAGGAVLGTSPGVGQVAVEYGYFSASTPVTVNTAQLVSMSMTPGNLNDRQYDVLYYTNTGTFDDGEQMDLVNGTVFSSQNQAIAQFVLPGAAITRGRGNTQVAAKYHGATTTTNLTVTSDVVTGMAVSPATATIQPGAAQQFNAVMTFDDGTTGSYPRAMTWASSNPAVLSVDAYGHATAAASAAATSVTLTATFHNLLPGLSTATATVTVGSGGAATLTSLAVTPVNATLLAGATQQFKAMGTYPDGTTGDVTGTTTWVSTNPLLFSIDKNGLGTALSVVGLAGRNGLSALAGTATSVPVTASNGGQSKTVNVNVLPTGSSTATLTSVAVTPSSGSFAKGTTQQFTLTGTYSDGSTQDLTSSATWTSSNAAVATISSGGLATGAGLGAVQLTGSYNGKTSSTGTVNVTAATLASIAVTPSSPSFAKGTTQQFMVIGTYTDGTTQDLTTSSTYASSNQGVVSVTSGGLAMGVGMGSAQVTIMSGGKTVTTGTVQVTPATLTSITVNPTSAHAAAGTTVQMTVTGTYTDGSTGDVTSSASWTTSAPSTATVSATGLVTGVTAGLASITAQIGTLTNTGVVRVGAATLVSTAISPSGASFATGTTQKFTLTGTFSDGSTQDLSSSATWTTSDGTVATISQTGLASGVAAGSVQFTASYGGMTAMTPVVSVQPATLVSIAVTPSSPNFAKGTTQQFMVTGTYSDGSMRDLTNGATFTSSNPAVVSISNAGLGQGLSTGSVQITVTAGGMTAMTQTVTVTPATLVSVVITPNNPSLAAGTSQQFTATGTFSDGTTQDLSGQVVWNSSNPQVMTIGQLGLASTFQTGTVQVSATIDGTTVMTAMISVSPATLASISLNPTTAQIAKGTVRQFTATGTYTDGSTQNVSSMVTWTSSNGSVVSIDANGLATGTGIGSATLTATLQGKMVSTNSFQVTAAMLVSIAFTPANPTVGTGSNSQIDVMGTYSDGSTQDLSSTAMYSSSNTAVATISSTGVIMGVSPGTSTITVTASGVTNSFNVTVSSATLVSVAISPANPAPFAKGTMQQFTLTGTYSDGTTQNLSASATWTSSNPAVFTIDRNGLATGTGVGSAQLTSAYQGQTAMTGMFQVSAATVSSLAITPDNASFAVGSTQQYTATATYSDNTTMDVSGSATWSSSNTSVISINSTGFATGMGAGQAMVRAQYMGLAGAVNVNVTAAAATLQQVVVSARTGGTNGTAGGTKQFNATAVYSDMSSVDVTNQAAWTSTNMNVATVSSTGLASLLSAGSTTIQAQYGGLTGAANVMVGASAVLQSIAISPSAASVAKGLTQQFKATGTYSDGSTQDVTTMVTWMSSNTAYATINQSGLATSTTGGQTQISASYQGQTAQVMLTVSAATLQSLALTPNSLNLANGTKQQIIATGTLSDGSTQDYTTSVNWSSSNSSNATVSASGVVSSTGVGPVTITAQAGGINASLNVNVTAATAASVQLTPSSVTIPVGGVQQFQATAMFTDGTSQDVTNSVTYTTSNPNVVTVDANGNLHGVGSGRATVTATLGSASTTATVNITMVALTSLAITPANVSLADGLSQQLTATGTFADGSTQNLTNTVAWTSSNAQVAPVSSTGKVSAMGVGAVTITATTDNMSATDQVTATAAAVSAISVTPANTTLAAGQTQQFAATATFTDGSQTTVTSSADWSVSDPTKGSISDSGSTKGLLTTTAAGTLNVVATINGVNGTVPVTVQPAALTVLRITPSPISTAAGTTQQLTVTGSYTDGSTANVTSSTVWTSGSASVATVDATGLLHAGMAGSTTVQATVQSTTATAAVTIGAATLNSIAITPSTSSLAKGLTEQMTAIGTYTDGSTANLTSQVQWSSSAPSVATVSGTGLVSTLSTGNATLTATLNSVSQTASLTVTAAVLESIAVTASQNSFALGLSLQLTATGTYSDGTTQNLSNSATWTSSAPSTGMVNSMGLATGRTTGMFTAQAAYGGKTGNLPLTVTAAVLQSITVTPANVVLVNLSGNSVQFTATGTFSDGTTQNLTNSVHWSLNALNVGSISQSGQFTALNVGSGTVYATLGMIVGSTGFTIVGA